MPALKIFVSHSSEDNVFCDALVDALREAGADVWIDKDNFHTGLIESTIEAEIRRRAVFILVLSPSSLKSSWVRGEFRRANQLHQSDADHSRIVLPVVARSIKDHDWLFLDEYRRICDGDGRAYPQDEAIYHTLNALSLSLRDSDQPAHLAMRAYTVRDLLDRGTALIARKRYAEALAFAEVASLINPRDTYAWSSKARALNYLHRNYEALTASNEAIQLHATNAMAWNYKGNALSESQCFQDAIQSYDRALAINGEYALAWCNKGWALHCLERYPEALSCFDRAITLQPEYSLAILDKGWTLHYLGKLDQALDCYDQVLGFNCYLSMAWHHRIVTLEALGRHDEAASARVRAAELGIVPSAIWTADDADADLDARTVIEK